MCIPSEMDAPSEMFFFLFDTIPGCLFVFISVGLRISLIDFYIGYINAT